MAQFDVYRRLNGPGYLLDCQSDLLRGLSHRFSVPLLPVDEAPPGAAGLNPTFIVAGEEVRMLTEYSAAVPRSELRVSIGSLADHHFAITRAIDILLSGV